jgi:hypothetical protein
MENARAIRLPRQAYGAVTMLKEQHGMDHGHANAIVAHTLAEDGK